VIVYWTDGLLCLLCISFLIGIDQIRRSPPLRRTWHAVFTQPLGMSSAVILSCFLSVALLDCVHFKVTDPKTAYPDPVISALDYLLTPLIIKPEKTYSAPFALVAFSKETRRNQAGQKIRDYPRLTHAGTHLSSPQAHLTDILQRGLWGLCLGLLLSGSMITLFHLTQARLSKQTLRTASWHCWRGKNPLAWRSGLITATLILTLGCVVSSYIGYYHVLGTDKVGEDILYQSLKSIRTGVIIGTLSTLFMLPLSLLLGMMAGYFKGWIDDVIQYIYTTLNSIPSILLIVAALLIVDIQFAEGIAVAEKADLKLLFLCLILGMTSWTGLCRLLRAETLKLRELEFIQAAHAFGINHFVILLRHILPNVMHIVLISIAIDFSGLVLAEAVLSYIGVGIDPTMNSWGNMVNGARLEMAREPMVWWTLMAAFLFMFTLVLAANLFADTVRDAFDPKTRP